MKFQYTENGDMILSNKPWFSFVAVICLLLVNFIAGGYAMVTNPISSWGPNIYIQLPLFGALGLFLAHGLNRKSEFYFDSKKRTVSYFVQTIWAEDRGVINTHDIVEITIQECGTDDSGRPLERLAIVCEKKEIPMSLTYTNVIDFESIKNEIDEWLFENGSA